MKVIDWNVINRIKVSCCFNCEHFHRGNKYCLKNSFYVGVDNICPNYVKLFTSKED